MDRFRWVLSIAIGLAPAEGGFPESRNRGGLAFHVLHGEGVARCDGKAVPIRKGDSLLLHPGSEHVIENTGAGKLYTLTVMTPNEGFSELIRAGDPVELDAEDVRILGGL